MKEKISILKYIIIHIGVIILASLIAIAVHALMPADTNVEDFDSILVKVFSFPVVATLYFIVLFSHCAITVNYFGKKSNLSRLSIGLRFGISYAIIYLLGMQEVVISASPYSEWGIDFVLYQLLIGISDAIPALILCVIIAKTMVKNNNVTIVKSNFAESILSISIIAITFTIVRIIGYHTGIISSDLSMYPVQTYIWTVIFGVSLGITYVLLKPVFRNNKNSIAKLSLFGIGLNWIIFNSFIGLIFDGLIWQMLLRSILDVVPFFIITFLLDRYFGKSYKAI